MTGGGLHKELKQYRKRAKWVEPVDIEAPRDARMPEADALLRRECSRNGRGSAVPDRIAGPFVVVRRVVESSDALTVPTLYMALDQKIGGTVEIADDGPFFNDDFRVAGDIPADPGTARIPAHRARGAIELTGRAQPAGCFRSRSPELVLDGIDLVVDVRDIYPEQTALFSCTASTLTLRNCSITVLNHNGTSFSVVRVEPGGSRIRHGSAWNGL